jgi:hypothetical protein
MGGLAVWNQLPWGVFLLACLGVALLGAFRLGLRPAFARVGAAALGFVVGVLPEILTRVLLSQAGVDTQYGPGTASGLWGYITSQLQPGGMLARSVFTHPWDPLYSAYRGFVWTHWVEEHWALSFLCIVPLTGVAVAALFRPRAIPVGFRPQLAMGLTYVVVVLAVMGKQFVDIGGGPDMRYGLTFWPILALLWTPGIAETVATRGLRWFTGLALWVALGVVLLTAALNLGTHAAHRLVTVHGIFYDQTAVIRYGGFVLAGLLGALFLFRGIRVSWKDQLVAGAIGFAGAAQILVLTISTNSGIFVAWPAGVGLSGLYWILMGDWPPYRP